MKVLVVGAGPTGLTAALALARHGVDVELCEAQESLGSRSLAATFHPPTLAILDELGVDLTGQGRIVDTIEYRRADQRVTLHLTEIADLTDFPYRLHLPQLELCRLLLDELSVLGNVKLNFGTEALPPATAGYDYVIAADGANSRWREAAGVSLASRPYDGQVARLICKDAFDGFAGVSYVFTDSDSVSVLRLADHARVILRVGEEQPDPVELVRRAVAVLGVEPEVTTWSAYRARRANVERNLVGNLLIIGDAGHQTNTRGGMNMNAGIHDAAILASALVEGDVEVAAVDRLRVWKQLLLPRTHATLGQDRFDTVSAIAADSQRRHIFLQETSMLDMIP